MNEYLLNTYESEIVLNTLQEGESHEKLWPDHQCSLILKQDTDLEVKLLSIVPMATVGTWVHIHNLCF